MMNETRGPDPMDVALGAAIRIRRRTLGLSQESLAVQCGVSFQQVQKYENGANRVSFSRLVQIARALKCRVTDLLAVLEIDQGPPADLDLLSRLSTPGAVDLLIAYERLPPESRIPLINFIRHAPRTPQVMGGPDRTDAGELVHGAE